MHNIEIYIPSLKENLYFKAITTSQQKDIYKNLLNNNNTPAFILCINDIIKHNIEKKHKDIINNLTVLDKLLILLKLRYVSMGWCIELEVTQESKAIKYDYDIINVYENLSKQADAIQPLIINLNSLYIKCFIPQLINETALYKITTEKTPLYINDISLYFINCIIINNVNVQYSSLTLEEKKEIYSNLPASITRDIEVYVLELLEKFNTICLYSILDIKLYFNIIGSSYTDYIKFIIERDLYNIYQEIYILTKHANVSADYVEKMTSVERDIYLSMLKQEKKIMEETASIPDMDTPISINKELDEIDVFKQTMGG